MNVPSSADDDPSTRAERLDQIIADYLVAEDQGKAPDPGDLMARHPEFQTELSLFFAGNERLKEAAGQARNDAAGSEATTSMASSSMTADLVGTAVASGPGRTELVAELGPVHYFGDYFLQRVLGRGGMGIVYQARQISLNRPVAVKMIRPDKLSGDSHDEIRRFRNEAEAIARLNHPNLLPILEIGEHNGHRYFSMPLITGGSLADHLGRYKDNLRDAVKLMITVAEAIHHAHQRGILHRDLKPANVLIDSEGRPHVGDFGLAKRLDEEMDLTQSGTILGTPAYMAPEQAIGHRSAATTSADVYGLGAILYALITGRSPFPGTSPLETLRRVRETAPERPRLLNRKVGRGLEMICLKCLEKDPKRRYASAAALAEDLTRWDRGEPILARPVSPIVRFGLWCRRRPGMAAMMALLVLAIAAGVGGVFWQWTLAEHQRKVADSVNEFFRQTLLGYGDPLGYAYSRKTTVEELFDRAASKVEKHHNGPPVVGAGIRSAIGNTYHALGRLEKAEIQLKKSVEIYRENAGLSANETLSAEFDLAAVLLDLNRVDEAGVLIQDAYKRLGALSSKPALSELISLKILAMWQLRSGKLEEAEKSYREVLAEFETKLDPEDPRTLEAAEGLGVVLQQRGMLGDAETYHRRALAGRRKAFPKDHPLILESLNSLAACLIHQGKLGEAEPLIGEATSGGVQEAGDQHYSTLQAMSNLGVLLLNLGRLGEAEKVIQRTFDLQIKILPESHADVLANLSNLATIQLRKGRADLAEPLLKKVVDLHEKSSGPDSFATARARFNLSSVYHDTNRFAEAAELMSASLPVYRKTLPAADPDLATLLAQYGSALLNSNRPAEAEPRLAEALAMRKKLLLPGNWRIAHTQSLYGGAIAALGRADDAEPLLVGALETLLKTPDAVPIRVVQDRRRLVDFYEARGEKAKADRWKAETIAPPVNPPR